MVKKCNDKNNIEVVKEDRHYLKSRTQIVEGVIVVCIFFMIRKHLS